MKSAVYTKAGQVGIEEIKRPQIKEADYPYRENLCLWYGLMDIS